MVIADITFNEPPKVPGVFYAVVSSESSFSLAHLQYPVDGAKDSDGQTLHRLARGVPSIDGAPPSKSSVEYRQELIEKYRSALALQRQEREPVHGKSRQSRLVDAFPHVLLRRADLFHALQKRKRQSRGERNRSRRKDVPHWRHRSYRPSRRRPRHA